MVKDINIKNSNTKEKVKPSLPRYEETYEEEVWNVITHGSGAIFAIVATILMLVWSSTTKQYVGAIFYGIGFFALYFCSTMYHAQPHNTKRKRVWRLFDHSTIYLLIGGTYAPILLSPYAGSHGFQFFIIQWILIAVGILFKFLVPQKTTVLHVVFCAILGWSGLMVLPTIYSTNINLFTWILIGGIIYTLGIAVFATPKKWSHVIWHFIVLGGSVAHFIGIAIYIFH